MLRWSLLLLVACHHPHRPPLPPHAPTTPILIPGINSPYDDFNSADMRPLLRSGLVFSTNRGSQGHDFDLYATQLGWQSVAESGGQTPTPFAATEPVPFAPALMSSREGGRNAIFGAHWDAGKTLDDPPATLARVAALASDGDDTAPYIYQRGTATEVVFASTRAGGLGEHDLWCARLVDGTWQPPVSLGPAINSARDEYRPIVRDVNRTTFLVFSSTRDGGQGGYDLYLVGNAGCPG